MVRSLCEYDGQETLVKGTQANVSKSKNIEHTERSFLWYGKEAIRNICEYSTIYFEWATENLDLMVDILTSYKIFLHNSDELNYS